MALVTVAMSRLPQLSGPEDQLPEEACTCASVQTTPAPANQTPQDLHLTNQKTGPSVSFLPDAPVAQSSYWCEPEQSRAAPSCLGARAPWRHRPGPGSGVQVSSAEMADSSLLSSLIGRDLSGPCCHWPETRALKGSSLARRRHEARAQRLAPELLLALVRVTHCVSS